MIKFPNAKINIGLSITEKRPDGFHNIESIFYPINWCDVLEILPSDTLQFASSGLNIDGNSDDNLCIKAYLLLKNDFNIPNVKIHLHKVIPMGAGLGGGSSDAAYTLKILNELFELKLTNEELESYCKKLGSDCAFFIKNKPVFAFNKGDDFLDIEFDLGQYKILCVYPNVHISTAEAYSGIIPSKLDFDLKKINSLPISKWYSLIKNDFEKEILKNHSSLEVVKNQMLESGAIYASMTGSGSTIFGIFSKEFEAKNKFATFEYKWV